MPTPVDIQVRLAEDADRAVVAALLVELQEHHQAAHPGLAAAEARLAALPAGVEFALAEDASAAAVGLAAFASIYPGPGLTGGFFLKELYVSHAARSSGVGEALMAFLASLARARGLGRIDWTVGLENFGALRFYDRLGATALTDRAFYRLQGDALARLADPKA